MEIGATTDIGRKRELNEDSFFVYQNQAFLGGFVADGMGGHQAGDIASKMASEFIYKYMEAELNENMDWLDVIEVIRHAFIEVNHLIYTYALENDIILGMGCTSTLALIYKNKLITAHVGDSRVYVVGDDIVRITKDHSYVQELLTRGEITEESAQNHPKKNYITRAMGTEDIIKIDVSIHEYSGEIVLICSDGLTNMISEEEIYKIASQSSSMQSLSEQLVTNANEAGGLDNITVVAFWNK